MDAMMEIEEPKQKAAEPAAPKTPPPDQEAAMEGLCMEQINALVDAACERRLLHVFVDVAAWKLAVIAHNAGPAAAGDILRRFGAHLNQLALRAEAAREAEEAKAQGRLPH